MCNKLAPPEQRLDQYAHTPLLLPLDDDTGDALVSTLYLPDSASREKTMGPVVVLIHGLGGSADSDYIQVAADYLLEQGYVTLTVNLRGIGASGPFCRRHNHPGRSEDIGLFLEALKNRLKPDLIAQGVILVGYSMGGNILLKFLGEQPEHPLVQGAVTVSAPLDLKKTAKALLAWRNSGYNRYLLRHIKRESLRPGHDLSEEDRKIVENAASVWEVDEQYTAPHLGFPDVETYYEQFSAKNFLDKIRVPTLLIQALDDPFVPNDTYVEFDWDKNPALSVLIVERGGHNGFHGHGTLIPWHNRCLVAFMKQLKRIEKNSGAKVALE